VKTLALVIGISGAGKSTYVKKLQQEHPTSIIICPDSIRGELTGDESDQSQNSKVFRIAHARLDTAMRNGIPFIIWDATGYNRSNRKEPIKIAKTYGYTVNVYVKKVDLETAKKQNQLRSRKVPDWVIERQFTGWQEPSTTEGIDSIIYV
jgi:predicted kinase